MKKLYNKVLRELIRYIHLRVPEDPNDPMFDKFFRQPDTIDVNERIAVEFSPYRHDYGALPGVDIILYEKPKPHFVRIAGWIYVESDMSCSRIERVVYNNPVSKYCSVRFSGVKYFSKFQNCSNEIGILLWIMEVFDELGGRKKDFMSFYYGLSALNISFI